MAQAIDLSTSMNSPAWLRLHVHRRIYQLISYVAHIYDMMFRLFADPSLSWLRPCYVFNPLVISISSIRSTRDQL